MNYLFLIFQIFFFIISVNYVESAKILGVFPLPQASHFILGSRLMVELAERGHEVVMITPFHVEKNPKNEKFKEIFIGDENEVNDTEKISIASAGKFKKQQSIYELMYHLNNFGLKTVTETLEHPKVISLLKSKEKFEAIIVQQFHMESLKILSWYFNAHLIVFSPIGANAWINHFVCNPSPPSYVPDIRKLATTTMTFFERMENTKLRLTWDYYNNFVSLKSHDQIVKKYFPHAPALETILYNTSLILLNSDVTTNPPVPKVPNMIDIGGFHVKHPKSLPDDIKEILDKAENGVIYFSMGSRLKSSEFSESIINMFLRIFSKLKLKILWKYDGVLSGKPENVVTKEWFPQEDILAHPNIRVFITQGGLISKIESYYHGVPTLSIPVFGDQYMNAESSLSEGVGHRISFYNLTEAYFEECILDLLNNPRFKENAEKKSELLKDKPIKPIDSAIFWVEYVIRHKGAKHLRVEGLKLSWYQYLLLDVVSVCFAVILISFMVMFYFINKILYIFKCQPKIKKN